MAKNPFHQLAVMKKVTERDRKVMDCYKLLYRKPLWYEATEGIFLRHKLKQASVNEAMIDQVIGQLQTNTLHESTIKKNPPIMNELLQQVVIRILTAIFGQAQNVRNQSHLILAIQEEEGKMHTLMTGSFSKDLQQSIYPILHEKIADKRFIHVIQAIVLLLEKQADQIFLTNDLAHLLRELAYQPFDRWMEKHDQDIYYRRYHKHFFISFKNQAMSVKEFTQEVTKFANRQAFILENLERQAAKRGIHFLGYKVFRPSSKICLQSDIPEQSIRQFIKEHNYGVWQTFTAKSRPYLLHLPEGKIIQVYNRELCLFASRYQAATNFHRLRSVLYLARKSLLQTIARKRNSTPKKIRQQLQQNKSGHTKFITYPQLKKLSKRIN